LLWTAKRGPRNHPRVKIGEKGIDIELLFTYSLCSASLHVPKEEDFHDIPHCLYFRPSSPGICGYRSRIGRPLASITKRAWRPSMFRRGQLTGTLGIILAFLASVGLKFLFMFFLYRGAGFLLNNELKPGEVQMRRDDPLRWVKSSTLRWFFCLVLLTASLMFGTSYLYAYLSDSDSYPPPTSGPYAYSPPFGKFMPDKPGFLAVGESYIDPLFGSVITRISNLYPNSGPGQMPYAKNGFWNADGTRIWSRKSGTSVIYDATTGRVVRSGVPGNSDMSFDPNDPDIFYYFSGSSLRQYNISTGQSSTIKTFSGTLGRLGGSVDWIDASGRYMVLKIGGVFRVWNKERNSLYSGSISIDTGGGWVGMAPDGSGVIIAANRTFYWHAIDHAAKSVNAAGSSFWTGGDHADFLTASDGNTYLVKNGDKDKRGNPALHAINVRTGSYRRVVEITWCDAQHYSGISRGPLRDWMVVGTYTSCGDDDTSLSNPTSNWYKFKQEIFMVNVLTGEVRRLAHHRSRETKGHYCRTPRPSVNWDGTKVMFTSSYGVTAVGGSCGYSDLYALDTDIPNPLDATAPVNPTGLRVMRNP